MRTQADGTGPASPDLHDRLRAFQHDARTPLNVVLGHAQLMGAAPLPPGARAQAHAILGAGRDLLRLLDDLEDAAR